MTYRITGLDPAPYRPLFGLSDQELEAHNARRVIADGKPGYPCRARLEDVEPGESLILFNYVSQDAPTPYRTAYAIYVSEKASEPATYVDELPPALQGRPLSLRGFDEKGMLRNAVLALSGEAEAKIGELFESAQIATIHAHNAAYGCFAAKIDRS